MFTRITHSTDQNQCDVTEVRFAPRMTMTVDEMADELNVSRPTAYELVKREDFPAFRIGQRILVNRKGLQHWIDIQSETPSVV